MWVLNDSGTVHLCGNEASDPGVVDALRRIYPDATFYTGDSRAVMAVQEAGPMTVVDGVLTSGGVTATLTPAA